MPIELPRRPATPNLAPSVGVVTTPPADEPKPQPEKKIRQMLVGREITLSGKITGCDRLVVEGNVEATLLECNTIEISQPGVFKGTVAVDHAQISGRFEGSLTVRKRLLIRESGQVSGSIRYGQLEVECGGQLSGDIGWDGMAPAEPKLFQKPTA